VSVQVKITTQDYEPLSGSVQYVDFSNAPVGEQSIPKGGAALDPALLGKSFTLVFSADGFYDFDSPAFNLSDSIFITLYKKPQNLLYAGIGAAIGFVLSKFYK
jgi:hypothetical protein